MARPSKYTPELFAEICERLSKGEPLAQICRDEHMPAHNTISDWKVSRPDVSDGIARAREIGFDAIALEALRIADDKEGEHQRDRLRVDTRLKLLAKWDPKRYGDKVQVGGDPEGSPMQMVCSWLQPE